MTVGTPPFESWKLSGRHLLDLEVARVSPRATGENKKRRKSQEQVKGPPWKVLQCLTPALERQSRHRETEHLLLGASWASRRKGAEKRATTKKRAKGRKSDTRRRPGRETERERKRERQGEILVREETIFWIPLEEASPV